MRLNNLTESEFYERLNKIKIFMFDLDGVLSNHSITEEQIYKQMIKFSQSIGSENLIAGVITAREWDNLTTRLDGLENCFVIISSMNKQEMMGRKLGEFNMKYENLLYVGDDILDLPLLQISGISCAPENARREVKRVVDIVLDDQESKNILETILSLGKQMQATI